MENKKLNTRVTTPEFRASFAHVMRPKLNEQTGKEEYSIVMLFPADTDISKLKEAAKNAVINKWPDEGSRPKGLKSPFRDGNEKDYDGYKGHIFITAKSQERPGLVDEDVQKIITEDGFYSGCYAIATVNAYAYDRNGNKGVAFALGNIQKTREGEKFGGGKTAEEDFAPRPRKGPEEVPF